MDKRAKIEKCGVAWLRKFKNGKEGIKISLNKVIYIAFKNSKKGDNEKAPDYIVVRFIDEPNEKKVEVKKEQL